MLPSRKLWRAPLSYCGPFKKEFISTWWAAEQSGALVQIGDPGKWGHRVSHKEIAAILGVTRETVTKRLMIFCSPDPEWEQSVLCKCHGKPRRECQSEKISAIAANHPHWQKGECGKTENASLPGEMRSSSGLLDGDVDQAKKISAQRLKSGTHRVSNVPEAQHELSSSGAVEGADCRRAKKDGARGRKHVAAILARNQGFNVSNSYALAVTDGARPGIGAGANQVGFLVHTFGAHLFSREKQTWLDPRLSLEGYRKSYGWIWDPHLPDAPDCACVTGQLKLEFQEICPKCGGAGFVVGGSMPDYGRQLLHWLLDRGIDEEIRYCGKCKRKFAGNEYCPGGCGSRGEVYKKRSELFDYTQQEIADANGMDVSTVRRYFTTFKRLHLVRTNPGDVHRKCQKCTRLPLYTGTCPGCGSTSDPIKSRDKQLIIWMTSRTLDKQIARTERDRLDKIVAWHKKWLDQKHQADLAAAVELAKKVLGEWEGREHLLLSFYSEMRRRLAASTSRASFVNVLFPLQRE